MAASAATSARPLAAKASLNREETLWAYVFLAPWIIGLIFFILGPMLFSLVLSFFNYTLGGDYTFAGLQAAQAAGDRQALESRERPLVRLHLTDRKRGINQLLHAVRELS